MHFQTFFQTYCKFIKNEEEGTMIIFNAALLKHVRKDSHMRQSDFAARIGVSGVYISEIEHRRRVPSVEVIRQLVDFTGIPVTEWLPEESVSGVRGTASDMKNRMNRDHLEIQRKDEEIWKLKGTNEHLVAIIQFYKKYVEISRSGLSKDEMDKRYKKLVIRTIRDGELNFGEIQEITDFGRSIIRNWLDGAKRPYECAQIEGGMIMASSPGEASLCLRCYTCMRREDGKCLGYGDEHPDNIVEMFDSLDAHGLYNASEQSVIFKTYYDLDYSERYIISIRYKIRHNLPIPDDVYYMDTARRTV
jgi:transcriptional regulator with XRE-family HTH domain